MISGLMRRKHSNGHYAFREILTNLAWFQTFLLLIFTFFTTADTVIIVVQIGNGGEWCFCHSISITDPKFELQPHIALKQAILSESAFYKKKYSFANCL